MKIKYLILFISLLRCDCVLAQSNKTKGDGWMLAGNVKSVIDIEHNKVDTTVQPYKIDMAYADTQYARFDEKGNIIEDGWHINPEFSVVPPPYPVGKQVYKYNSTGQLTEELVYKGADTMEEKCDYQYDAKGNKTEMVSYKPDGNVGLKHIYTCDKKGNILKETDVDDHGTPESEEDYKYDSKGNQTVSEATYYSGGMSYKFIRKYDENGKCTEQYDYKSKSDKNYAWKSTHKFDDKGNFVEWDSFKFPDEPMGKEVDTYVYDTHGNWIQCNETNDGKPAKLTIRSVYYF